jgi:hypothetical protein
MGLLTLGTRRQAQVKRWAEAAHSDTSVKAVGVGVAKRFSVGLFLVLFAVFYGASAFDFTLFLFVPLVGLACVIATYIEMPNRRYLVVTESKVELVKPDWLGRPAKIVHTMASDGFRYQRAPKLSGGRPSTTVTCNFG